jgi:hypothetical protein
MPRRANLDLEMDDARLLVDRHSGAPVPLFDPFFADGHAVELLARTPEMSQWRTDGLVIVGTDSTAEGDLLGRRRGLFLVPPTEGSGLPAQWTNKSMSDILDVDPGAIHFARFVGQTGTSTAEAPHMNWRTGSTEEQRDASGAPVREPLVGVWLEGEAGPIAVFDPGRMWEWWTAPSIRRVWTEGPFLQVASAELLADIPLDAAGPALRGDDWIFHIERSTLARPVRGEARFVLDLVDMATLAFARIDLAEHADGTIELVAPGAAGFERAVRARGGGPLVWSLDRRIGGTAIARAGGRR